jgi:hypothetical protein
MRLAHIRHQSALREPAWHILLAVGVAISLQLALNDVLVFGFKYALVGLEILLLLVLSVISLPVSVRRLFAMFLIALISGVNIISLGLVIGALFGNTPLDGRELLISSLAIFLTNIIVFGLWYWELDNTRQYRADFLFPQLASSEAEVWRPTLFDYLYVSVTNAIAFSPTDTLPLTHRAKLLMMIQSVVSLVTIGLVVARAVNILA